jgi:hypothetical protein
LNGSNKSFALLQGNIITSNEICKQHFSILEGFLKEVTKAPLNKINIKESLFIFGVWPISSNVLKSAACSNQCHQPINFKLKCHRLCLFRYC